MHEIKGFETPLSEIFGESAVEVTFRGCRGAFIVAGQVFKNSPGEKLMIKTEYD